MNLDMGSKSKWFFVFLKERSEDLRLHARNIIFPRSLIAIRKHLRALEYFHNRAIYYSFFRREENASNSRCCFLLFDQIEMAAFVWSV